MMHGAGSSVCEMLDRMVRQGILNSRLSKSSCTAQVPPKVLLLLLIRPDEQDTSFRQAALYSKAGIEIQRCVTWGRHRQLEKSRSYVGSKPTHATAQRMPTGRKEYAASWQGEQCVRPADLAHVAEVLEGQGLGNAPAPLQGFSGHDRAPLHVIHDKQHFVSAWIIHHLLLTVQHGGC